MLFQPLFPFIVYSGRTEFQVATGAGIEIPTDRKLRFERRPSQRYPARKPVETGSEKSGHTTNPVQTESAADVIRLREDPQNRLDAEHVDESSTTNLQVRHFDAYIYVIQIYTSF